MAGIIIENQPIKHQRPKTTDSTMFVGMDKELYFGYYLKTNHNKAQRVFSKNLMGSYDLMENPWDNTEQFKIK